MQLTVKSDVMEGEDNWPVSLRRALHGAVHLPKWSLHILLLVDTNLCETSVISNTLSCKLLRSFSINTVHASHACMQTQFQQHIQLQSAINSWCNHYMS